MPAAPPRRAGPVPYSSGTTPSLRTETETETPFDRAVNHRPVYAAALRDVETALWQQDQVDALTLELCRLRIAQILGCHAALSSRTPEAVAAGLDEALVAALAQWPTDRRFDSRLRTCLDYAEQLLIDASEVSDEHADRVVGAIGEGGFLVLTYACGLFETTQRARLLLGRGPLTTTGMPT